MESPVRERLSSPAAAAGETSERWFHVMPPQSGETFCSALVADSLFHSNQLEGVE